MAKRRVQKTSKGWKPLELYEHQEAARSAYLAGFMRFFLGWHRRAGKDTFALDFARDRAQERVGTYWHMFPYHVQAKRAIWKGIDARTGERFIDRAFPHSCRKGEPNETEMAITMECGSTWQMLGSDNYDRMVGSNPCGIIFSEWALCDPAAWEYIRPILMENKGWAMFITTFRGRNHAYRMYQTVKDAEGWYCDLRTVRDTHKHDGSPIVSEEDIQKEIAEGMDPALVQQEFYCNPDAATQGAIFNRQHSYLSSLQSQSYARNNRIIRVAWGMHEEGIAATAFQDGHIIACHTFLESNITDAAKAVAHRHPNELLIHHGINLDPSLFDSFDGAGVVAAPLVGNEHIQSGHTASILSRCSATAIARERLLDFTMSYAPYRKLLDDTDLTHAALAQSLAVMHTAQVLSKSQPRRPIDYSRSDRGVI
jgi:hypothetical protein